MYVVKLINIFRKQISELTYTRILRIFPLIRAFRDGQSMVNLKILYLLVDN